jgi:hypothetical protein
MGRAYRYVRRIAHLEIVLAERGKNGPALASVLSEEEKPAAAPVKTAARKAAKKKKTAGKKQ